MSFKRYNALAKYLAEHFGEKVFKVAVDSDMTCPNRDGTISRGGCIYCYQGSHYKDESIRSLPVKEQIHQGIEYLKAKRKINKFIVYFQAYTGTYTTPEALRSILEDAISVPGVEGISIATRPDCLDNDIVEVLYDLSKITYMWVEIGVQSVNNLTLAKINRGHDYRSIANAICRLKERGIRCCAHVILFLPGEGITEILYTARTLSDLGVDGIKLHHLHILKDTYLHRLYEKGQIYVPDIDNYVGVVCDFLENISETIVIHRLLGDAPYSRLVAPLWEAGKLNILNRIDRELEARGSFQGAKM